MRKKAALKLAVDLLMTAALLLLMTYNLLGDAFHEWVGAGMLVLFLLHHALNIRWSRSVFRGRYSAYRVFQTILDIAILLTMLGSLVSGVILSRYVFRFLNIAAGRPVSRTLHLVCAYWNLILLAAHLGLHWNMILAAAKRSGRAPSSVRAWASRAAAALLAVYGIYALLKRDIGSYMTLQTHFIFLDYEEPLVFFLFDYLAVMGVFIFVGHYLALALRKRSKS